MPRDASSVTSILAEILADHPIHDSEHDNFTEMMRAAVAGDIAAQQQLCEQYEPKIRIVARVLLGPALRSVFDSMDIVQSVHQCLLIGLRDNSFEISSPDKLIALANTLVRRKVARKWRKLRREKKSRESTESVTELLLSLTSPETGPEAAAEQRDLVEHLYRSLNDVERRLLELRLDGLDAKEIADRIGIHSVALRVRWMRLKRRLLEQNLNTDWL